MDRFVWGVSTAAYQIEGAVAKDGRGRSIWDTFVHEPGRVANGDTGDVACDHYHRYREDVALMAGLGVDAYRFSVAWSRVQPDGRGAPNPAGLAFYDRLVDELLTHDIDPVVTLFHWDLPQALQDAGGWFNRDTADRFADYADLVAAPGQALMFDALPTAHHQLLAHGKAVSVLRGRSYVPVTIANNYSPVVVFGDTEADRAAGEAYDALHNRLFTDPLFGRGYPDGFDLPVRDGDLDTIAAPLDALGVNYYNPTGIRAASTVDSGLPFDIVALEGYPVTDFDWPVVPEGLGQILTRLHEDYGAPLYVTESGCAYAEVPDDQRRIDYLAGHIDALEAVRAGGVDVRGYFVWSIMDNFEWAEGFSKRFGLVHVDFDTLARTPRASYAWLRDRIAQGRS
jgi:beta-glucosidase